MNIVVTDGYTLNAGDLSWESISLLGALTVYDRTPAALVEERCKEADIVVSNKVRFSSDILLQLPQLKCISVSATGFDIIDTSDAKKRGIVVCNVPAYGTASVSQHVFALLLELTNHVGLNSSSTRQGKWQQSPDWCYTERRIMELSGKIFGIVGFGNIGAQTAQIANAFGMKVIYYNPTQKESDIAEAKNLVPVFKESDVVSLHCPLKPDNIRFVNTELLQAMKPAAFFINTARGQLIQEADLAYALNQETIAGAALDALSSEPPSENNPLLSAKNCIITPHNAWMSKEARQRIMDVTKANIEAFLNGTPVNVVNK